MEAPHRDTHNSLAAVSITTPGQISEDFTARYLQKIVEILEIVFELDKQVAREATARFEAKWNHLDESGRLTLLNLSPLQVAADLGGAWGRPLTHAEENKYRNFIGAQPVPDNASKETREYFYK